MASSPLRVSILIDSLSSILRICEPRDWPVLLILRLNQEKIGTCTMHHLITDPHSIIPIPRAALLPRHLKRRMRTQSEVDQDHQFIWVRPPRADSWWIKWDILNMFQDTRCHHQNQWCCLDQFLSTKTSLSQNWLLRWTSSKAVKETSQPFRTNLGTSKSNIKTFNLKSNNLSLIALIKLLKIGRMSTCWSESWTRLNLRIIWSRTNSLDLLNKLL